MANFYKDIKLNNVEANKVLTVGADGVIKATTTNINDIASASEVQNISNNLNAVVTNVTNLQNDVGTISNNLNTVVTNVTNLQNDVGTINNNMANIVVNISNLDNRVSSLENATATISSRLTNINGE